MRLHVGVLRTEQFLRAVAREVLDDVGELAPAVVALGRIALGVLVGEDRAGGFEHGFADKVLGCDQFQAFMLTPGFVVNGGGDLRGDLVERAGDRRIVHRSTGNIVPATRRSRRASRVHRTNVPRGTFVHSLLYVSYDTYSGAW